MSNEPTNWLTILSNLTERDFCLKSKRWKSKQLNTKYKNFNNPCRNLNNVESSLTLKSTFNMCDIFREETYKLQERIGLITDL